MKPDWNLTDRWLMGEAFVGSTIADSINVLCRDIGVRWAGTSSEHAAAEFAAARFEQFMLPTPAIEDFVLNTSDCHAASLQIDGVDSWCADARPCLFCPSVDITAPLIDVGYGMPHELAPLREHLTGRVALIRSDFEPFTEPVLLTRRLQDLARLGVSAAITGSPHKGRQLSHVSVSDWRDDPTKVPLPLVQTSAEDAARLKFSAAAEASIAVRVEATFRSSTSWNTVADLPGTQWPDQSIVLGAHHDTTPDSFGANDNGAGVAVMLETARLLAGLADTHGIHPGRTIRFVSFGAEEQGLQGSTAFVERHYGPEPKPRFMLALDELATGNMKGVVLQFPELRSLIQQQLDLLNEGLQCHVLAQLDASGDMFPFSRQAVPSAFLWRWRFVGRHPEASFGHSSADTPDKLRLRELKEYAGLLSRLLLRLSHVPPAEWPANTLDVGDIATRIQTERGAVFRTM
ncbi:MAG: M28 family metallopeptidase [Fuerstiella sp.]